MPGLDLRVLVLERRLGMGSSLTIPYGSITGVPGPSLLGRYSATTGVAQAITLGTGLSLSGAGVLSNTGLLAPGGLTTQAQYNMGGTLAGSSGLMLSATQVTSITYADQAAGRSALGLGTMATQQANAVSITGGTLTTSTLSTVYGPTFFTHEVGIGTAAVAGYSLTVQYQSQFNSALGANTLSVSNAAIGAGNAYALTVWPGGAYLNALAVGGNPGAAMNQGQVVTWGAIMGPSVSLNRGTAAPRWELDVQGSAGIAGSLGVAGPVDSRWHFINWGTSYFAGTCQHAGYCGFGYGPDGAHWIRGGNSQLDSLGIGQGSHPSYSLVVAGATLLNATLYVSGTTQLASYSAVAGAPDNRFVWRMYGHIYCDGVPYNGGGGPWVAYSDARLKHHVHAIPHPLETMCRLRGVQYEWRDTTDGKPPGVHYGVIAQEVEAVLPQWVGKLDGYKTTQLSRFEALTIEAIKALTARVVALEEQAHVHDAA